MYKVVKVIRLKEERWEGVAPALIRKAVRITLKSYD